MSSRISPRPSASPAPEKHSPSSAPPVETNGKKFNNTDEPDMELDLPPSPPPVEDLLAARRAKRQAILAKYTGIASVSESVSSGPGPRSAAQSPVPDSFSSVSNLVPQSQPIGVNGYEPSITSKSSEFCMNFDGILLTILLDQRDSASVSPTPRELVLAKESDVDGNLGVEHTGEQFSAVDYDPSLDRREDQQKLFGVERKVETIVDDGEVEMEVEEEDDVDDMFAISTTKTKVKKSKVRFLTRLRTLIQYLC
jgi:serine/threonine-protein kinase PRP4